jgi:hypothetical protein
VSPISRISREAILLRGIFSDDCAAGELPTYTFLEPHFINFFENAIWHDDMHLSSFGSRLYSNGGPGTVLLGDRLVWKIYQAIRNSKANREIIGRTPSSSSRSMNMAGVSIISHRRQPHRQIQRTSTPVPVKRASILEG